MQSCSQKHANQIYALVNELRQEDQEVQKKYAGWCQRFAPLILQNGLVQTIGFLEVKSSDKAAALFLQHISALLHQTNPQEDFKTLVRTADIFTYQRLTRQALASATWFRRYTVSVLGIAEDEVNP